MKKVITINFMLLAIAIGVVVIGCRKDSDTEEYVNPDVNKVLIGDDIYTLNWALIEKYSDASQLTNYVVWLYSESIKYNQSTGEFVDNMLGEVLYLDIYSSSDTEIAEGTYTYSDNTADKSFVQAWCAINYNISDYTNNQYYNIESGTVEVKKINGKTLYILDLITKDRKNITGEIMPEPLIIVD